MAVESKMTVDGENLIISVDGKFDFSLLTSFRQSYSEDKLESVKVVVDMQRTTVIDSSALGMLLNMQRHLKKSDMEINIINCNENVKKVFEITHFDKKFTIE